MNLMKSMVNSPFYNDNLEYSLIYNTLLNILESDNDSFFNDDVLKEVKLGAENLKRRIEANEELKYKVFLLDTMIQSNTFNTHKYELDDIETLNYNLLDYDTFKHLLRLEYLGLNYTSQCIDDLYKLHLRIFISFRD
ncbi:MAG: hypothetical protein IJ086_14085 [Clostridium sp.]|nr:hypothetical protein [Clostridium sp.]